MPVVCFLLVGACVLYGVCGLPRVARCVLCAAVCCV